jgi:arylsulfate sulfotransferase
MSIRSFISWCVWPVILVVTGCSGHSGNPVEEIHIGLHQNNELKIQVDVLTREPMDVYVRYWPDSLGDKAALEDTAPVVPGDGLSHSAVLCNILPNTHYSYQVSTVKNGVKTTGKTYTFASRELPMWLKEQFKYTCDSLSLVPAVFKEGLMLLNKRETPGVAYLVDYLGRLRWYHMVDGTGFKVTHFTKDHTILSILGKNDEPTSYGSEILEINLAGDTVLHLKKGMGDFRSTIHHEILKNNKGQILTLFVDQRVMDLSAIGGGRTDTVNGDGILILDTSGKKVWQWSVFDVVDPLKDPKLLKTKKDWMHANSLNFDKDSNYIVSFYNNGQIWKIDAVTGKILWKFGKGGSFQMPAGCSFTQAHAVHINSQGNLMFFDNGVEHRQSEAYALKLDQARQVSELDLHIKLPKEIYNDRMGSAYLVDDSTVLVCSSKRHITVLANRKGVLLWTLDTAIPPYRVEFLKKEEVMPWLDHPPHH